MSYGRLLQIANYNKESNNGNHVVIDRFSACGGIRTDFQSVSTAILSCAALGHIGKERITRDATTRRLPYRAKGLFYPGWDRLHSFTAYLWQCGLATLWS